MAKFKFVIHRNIETTRPTRDEFEAGFHRGQNGNLSRRYQGSRLTIFKRGDGHAWCIASVDGVGYSPTTFETETDALAALASELGLGE